MVVVLSVLLTALSTAQVRYTATERQVTLHYETAASSPCQVEASANPTYFPRVSATESIDPDDPSRRTLTLGALAELLEDDEKTPLWLDPDRTYYVRISCENDDPIEAIVHTEPAAISPSSPKGGERASSCATMLGTGSWFPQSGGNYYLPVSAAAQCSWNATSDSSWVMLTGGNATGPGSITYTVMPNEGFTRYGTITLGTQTYTIRQTGLLTECTYTFSSSSSWFPSTGGSYVLSVTAPYWCPWTANSSVGWAHITSGGSGAGSGTIQFTVDPNGPSVRTGYLAIGGATFNMMQAAAAACAYSLGTSSSWFGTEGGTYDLRVLTLPDCSWTATSSASWVQFPLGNGGAGPGVLRYVVEPNPGPVRTAQINLGGATFTLNQLRTLCTFSLSYSSSWFPDSGGSYSVLVSGGPGCTWTASSPVSWVRIGNLTQNPNGGGTVAFQIDENFYSARYATLSIAGKTLQINQTGKGWPPGCSVRLESSGSWFPANTGINTNLLNVLAPAGCPWTVSSNASWIRLVSSPAGSGSAAITYSIDTNTGAYRSGAITVGGQQFVVQQVGMDCSFSLTYAESWFPSLLGTYEVGLVGPSACSWSAQSTVLWARVIAPTTGSGTSILRFVVDANTTGAVRTGEIRVGGKTLVLRQVP